MSFFIGERSTKLLTDIYKLDENGEISFHSSYSLPAEEALKCAAIQITKRFDTWNYQNIFVPIKRIRNQYYFTFGENKALFTINREDS
jgi:hypothetical protein